MTGDITDLSMTRRDFGRLFGAGAFVAGAASLAISGCNGDETEQAQTSKPKHPIEISPGLEEIAIMSHTHYDCGVLAYKNLLHIIGGSNDWAWTWPTKKYSTFDPENLIWTPRREMPEALARMASFIFEGDVMTVGGKGHDKNDYMSGPIVDHVFRYNSDNNQWATQRPFPSTIASAESVVADGVPHILGGYTKSWFKESVGDSKFFAHKTKEWNMDVFMYDKSKDNWEVRTRIPIPVYGITATAKDGKIYIFGSKKRDYMLQIYDTRKESWDKRELPGKFYTMSTLVRGDRVNLWTGKYSSHPSERDYVKDHALYSWMEGDKWEKVNLPKMPWCMTRHTQKAVLNDYFYLVGPTGITLAHEGKIHRLKLPSKQTMQDRA